MTIAQKNLNPHPRHPGELPAYVDEKTFTEFLARQTDVLNEMESLILNLEQCPENPCVSELKRLLHTLKGEAGLLALDDVERLCHNTEDFLNSSTPCQDIDLLFSVKDWIDNAFGFYSGKSELVPDAKDIIEKTVRATKICLANSCTDINPLEFAEVTDQMRARIGAPQTRLDGDPAMLARFAAFVKNQIDLMGIRLLTLETDPKQHHPCDEIYRCFNQIEGIATFFSANEISALVREIANLLDQTRKGKQLFDSPIIDLTFEAVDTLKELVQDMETGLASINPMRGHSDLPELLGRINLAANGRFTSPGKRPRHHSDKKIGELLVASGSAEPRAVEKALKTQETLEFDKRIGEILVVDDHIAPRDVAHALREQKEVSKQVAGINAAKSIRVDSERLDRLIAMLGELAIAEIAVTQSSEIKTISSQRLNSCLRDLNRVTRDVQQLGLSLRMIPIRPIFQKMERVVRDVAKKTGKQVKCHMSGHETELDKTLVDKIGDPLIHIVRNAVDHGIESNLEARRAAGKQDTGTVEIRAFHRGGNIHIEIQDDGIGIDCDKIVAKAKKLGLIQAEEVIENQQAFELLFKPGFSTASSVTEISGRGVGLDVVRRSIESLQGQVDLQSNPGKGSLFSLRIPLTLAIVDGMVVRIGNERYIIPTLSIIKTLKINTQSIVSVQGHHQFVKLQNRLVRLVCIDALFRIEANREDDDDVLIVVVESGNNWVALIIDELMGKQQVVIKSLGEQMKNLPGITGATIMPDGRIGLILDVNGLFGNIRVP